MYEDTTYEVILDRMLNRVPDYFDKREGSIIWDTHSPAAIEFQILYLELDQILKEAYGDTASREFLILRCKERGIHPYPSTKAVLRGVFTPSNMEMTGKRFSMGSLYYTVMEKITEGEYQVQCETEGKEGNQYFGSMIPVEYMEGLEKAELTEVLIPGEEEEETEELRQRYFASFDEKAFGGNVRDYLEKTNGIPGVGETKVTRAWNGGITPSAMIPTEEVKTWYQGIQDTVGEEVKDWLDMVYRAAGEKKLTVGGTVLLTILNSDFNVASDTLIQRVQETLDPEENAGEGYGFAPIGHVVSVQSAEGVPIKVRTNITFDSGYDWNNLQGKIDRVINDYLLDLRKSWADNQQLIVRTRQIESRLLAIQGILDIQDTLINGSDENLILGEFQVPIFEDAGPGTEVSKTVQDRKQDSIFGGAGL